MRRETGGTYTYYHAMNPRRFLGVVVAVGLLATDCGIVPRGANCSDALILDIELPEIEETFEREPQTFESPTWGLDLSVYGRSVEGAELSPVDLSLEDVCADHLFLPNFERAQRSYPARISVVEMASVMAARDGYDAWRPWVRNDDVWSDDSLMIRSDSSGGPMYFCEWQWDPDEETCSIWSIQRTTGRFLILVSITAHDTTLDMAVDRFSIIETAATKAIAEAEGD